MKRATVVIDLAYGDSGKGSIVDYLVREQGAEIVVRFNGGPQAAHTVVLPDGKHHVFSQFGSGSFVPGVKTFLSKYVAFNPLNLMVENQHLRSTGLGDALERLIISPECPIVTPYHKALGRIRELMRGGNAHGTTGQGVWETWSSLKKAPLFAGDLALGVAHTTQRLSIIREYAANEAATLLAGEFQYDARTEDEIRILRDQYHPATTYAEWFVEIINMIKLAADDHIIRTHSSFVFEGAQGVLLDEWYGWHPHTTAGKCTAENALALIDLDSDKSYQPTVLGLLRGYLTRHGAGPFPTESKLSVASHDEHNGTGAWQGPMRYGHFDLITARYAIEAAQPDALVITCLDKMYPFHQGTPVATGYQSRSSVGLAPITPVPRNSYPIEERERVTNNLFLAHPVYDYYPHVEPGHVNRAYAEGLAHDLDKPLALISFGPTHEHKAKVVEAVLA